MTDKTLNEGGADVREPLHPDCGLYVGLNGRHYVFTGWYDEQYIWCRPWSVRLGRERRDERSVRWPNGFIPCTYTKIGPLPDGVQP